MNHPFNPLIELALVVWTLFGLFLLSLLAAWMHRAWPAPAVEAAREPAPARAERRAGVAQARDTQPYRMDAGVAVGGPDPGRHERVEALK